MHGVSRESEWAIHTLTTRYPTIPTAARDTAEAPRLDWVGGEEDWKTDYLETMLETHM